MRVLLLGVVILQAAILIAGNTCPPSGRVCITSSQYQKCQNVSGIGLLSGGLLKCPEGQVCSTFTPSTCNPVTTTSSPVPTSTPLETTPTGTIEKYHESLDAFVGTTDLSTPTTVLPTTPNSISTTDSTIIPTSTVETTTISTTETSTISTTETSTTPTTTGTTETSTTLATTPKTTFPTTYTTITTTNSNILTITPTGTTTTEQTTTQTQIPTTISPPVCNSTAVYPGPTCNQYYHCLFVMWWWDYEILTCPTGQAFDSSQGECAPSSTCNS